MEMPIRSFWSATANVSRISAERDLRLLKVLAAANNGEQLTALFDVLKNEQGTPTVAIDRRREVGATDKLRRILTS